MLIFLSWSGERSGIIAEALNDWLPKVIQSVNTYYSPETEKGTVGANEIRKNLKESSFGVICLTPENLYNNWINFEAGALSKFQEEARVWTLLFDLKHSDIPEPLRQFQHTLCSEQEVFKLVKSINSQCSGGVDLPRLQESFETRWPRLNAAFEQARAVEVTTADKAPNEMMKEILKTLREGQARTEYDDSARYLAQLTGQNTVSRGTSNDVNRRYK